MESHKESYMENLEKAAASIRIADHILYVTYPLINEKKLILKALEEVYNSLLNIINAILQYDYIWKRIKLYSNPQDNFETFKEKCSKRYNITEQELSQLLEIFKIMQSHKKSPMEFLRQNKIIIMSDNLTTFTISHEKVKSYLFLSKTILARIKQIIKPI